MMFGERSVKSAQHLWRGIFLSDDGVIRADPGEDLVQTDIFLGRKLRGFLQAQSLYPFKSIVFRQKRQQQGRNGAQVGRVEIKIAGADHNVFRVGRLED